MGGEARDLLLLYVLGLIVNGAVALLVRDPGYLDATYYLNGGVALAEGRGFSAPYIWNYVGAPAALPAPSFTYWQPLPALLSALGIVLFGRWMPAFDAAQMVFMLLGAALPLLSYAAAVQIGQRRHALLAGLLTVFGGYYVVYWSLPESFTPFALSGAGALILAGTGRASRRWWAWLLAGACAGLAHLARADGLLLAGVVALSALLAWGQQPAPRLRARLGWAGLATAGYLLVMAPWFARNLAAFGSVQAPGGLSTLWMVEYNDLFRYPSDLTPARFFAAGAVAILRARGQALLGNLATFTGVHNMVFLLPLTLIGAWQRRRDARLLPALLYAPLLFAAMTFAFALPGLRGGWLHSGAALVPLVTALAVVGLDHAIGWAARRRGWRAGEAWQVFAVASVLIAAAVTAFVMLTRVVGTDNPRAIAWNQGGAVYRKIGAALDAIDAPQDALVMSNNPPGLYLRAGRGGVPIPAGPEAMLLRAADDYGVTLLVIDHNIPPELESFYWLGPASDRFVLLGTYGSSEAPIYLYRILPPAPPA
jgi:hypothetical protein